MKKNFVILAMVFMLSMAMAVAVVDPTPSTNEDNKANGWAHFNVLSVGPGTAEVEFVQPRGFYACFEYRTDGDLSQSTGDNYNGDITDGLYPFVCLSGDSTTMDIPANEYIEIRMVFGAEKDERFDWTAFKVEPVEEEVPEFGLIAGVAVLAIAGLFIWRRRN